MIVTLQLTNSFVILFEVKRYKVINLRLTLDTQSCCFCYASQPLTMRRCNLKRYFSSYRDVADKKYVVHWLVVSGEDTSQYFTKRHSAIDITPVLLRGHR